MRKRRRRGRGSEWPAVVALAFGLGLFLSLFCSVKFVLFLVAVALICLGAASRC